MKVPTFNFDKQIKSQLTLLEGNAANPAPHNSVTIGDSTKALTLGLTGINFATGQGLTRKTGLNVS